MLNFSTPTFETVASKEWLVTNGIGGYASGTISGANTRRYHGLLVASMFPPTQRRVLVTKVEEAISLGRDTQINLSSNRFPGVIHPSGYQFIKNFERAPLVSTLFEVGSQILKKTVFMSYGRNASVVEYQNLGSHAVNLWITPFFVDRDYHHLFKEDIFYDYFFEQLDEKTLKIFSHYGALPLYFKFYKGTFETLKFWFKNFEYSKEEFRGLEYQEDAFVLGRIQVMLKPGESTFLLFSLDMECLWEDPEVLKQRELDRLREIRSGQQVSSFEQDLKVAANQFIVKRQSTGEYTILAGYPWFTDWGRDSMIALKGLCLLDKKPDLVRSVLRTFLDNLKRGLIPNRFPDDHHAQIEYNTVDASLWLFIRLYDYYQEFDDLEFIKVHFTKLTEIIAAHLQGTINGIHTSDEGFLQAGDANTQLTWMDAKVEDQVVTPRHGSPVEVQALWYNALAIYQFFANLMEGAPADLLEAVTQVKQQLEVNFESYFLNEKGYLNDVIFPDQTASGQLRPNQLFVISLPFHLIKDRRLQKGILQKVSDALFTPYGLRSLDEADPAFRPTYAGDQWSRDAAYHQGTVWPFLLAPYFSAWLRVEGATPEVQQQLKQSIQVLREHFYCEDGIHGLSEIFDGATPCAGRGTIHQAWSVAALLELIDMAKGLNINLNL